MTTDYYAVLGVSDDASSDDIKRSYRKLAKRYHPDRHKGDKKAEAKFKEVSEANAVLSDKEKRSEYDIIRKYGDPAGMGGAYGPMGGGFAGNRGTGPSGGPAGGFSHFAQGPDGSFHFTGNIEDIISEMLGSGSGGRGRGSGSRFNGDPFAAMFGGGRQAARQQSPPSGSNIKSAITITFMEAIHGTKKLLKFGDGKKIRVTIPTGIENGKIIRLSGQGEASQYEGGKNGNLNITVRVMEDKMFTRKGNDIHTFVEIPFNEAILGCKKTVKTLTKSVAITIAPGTQPGTKLRLKGIGLDVAGGKGDLYVEVRVTIPTTLSEEQKKLLDDWGE